MTVDITVDIEYDSKIDDALRVMAKEIKTYTKEESVDVWNMERSYSLKRDVHDLEKASMVFVYSSGHRRFIQFFTNGIYWDEKRNKQILTGLME